MFDIPEFSVSLVFIVIDVFLVNLCKKFIKHKQIYPYLPVIFGVVFGVVVTYFFDKDVENISVQLLKNMFTIVAGSIAGYDLLVEKIEIYIEKMQSKAGKQTEIGSSIDTSAYNDTEDK